MTSKTKTSVNNRIPNPLSQIDDNLKKIRQEVTDALKRTETTEYVTSSSESDTGQDESDDDMENSDTGQGSRSEGQSSGGEMSDKKMDEDSGEETGLILHAIIENRL